MPDLKEISDQINQTDKRLAVMERMMGRMETAVTTGMATISEAMKELAVVSSKQQENGEQHHILHQRIDGVHEKAEKNELDLLKLRTEYDGCCGSPKPEKPFTLQNILLGCLAVTGLTAFLALIMMHAKELINIIFGR